MVRFALSLPDFRIRSPGSPFNRFSNRFPHHPASRHFCPFLRDRPTVWEPRPSNHFHVLQGLGSGVLAAVFGSQRSERLCGIWQYRLLVAVPGFNSCGSLLVEALRDENKHVRVEAINSIKNIRWIEAVPELKRIYDTATVDEEYSISETIKSITGENYPPETVPSN